MNTTSTTLITGENGLSLVAVIVMNAFNLILALFMAVKDCFKMVRRSKCGQAEIEMRGSSSSSIALTDSGSGDSASVKVQRRSERLQQQQKDE